MGLFGNAMDQRIIDIEKRVAFQERLIEDLNSALLEQQKKIVALESQVQGFQNQMSRGDLVRRQEDETPPPHY